MKRRLAGQAIVLLLMGGTTMAQTTGKLSLTWQWGGVAAHRVLITVDSVKKESAGLLGLGNSPSVAGYLPDPRIVRGPAIAGDATGEVRLRIPAYELPPVQPGAFLAISYTEGNMAICVARAPAGLDARAGSAWLAAWNCVPGP